MKGKFKVGDIVEYRERFYFSDDIQIIGYIIDASITDAVIPIGYYRIIVLREDKKGSFRNGQVVYVGGYYESFVKLY